MIIYSVLKTEKAQKELENSDTRGKKWDWVVSDKGQKLYTKKKMRMVKKLVDWAKKKDKKLAEGRVFLLFSLVMKLPWEITTLIHVTRDEKEFLWVL